MTGIAARVAHYPVVFQRAIHRACREKTLPRPLLREHGTMRSLSLPGEITQIELDDLRRQGIIWVYAVAGPCTVAAVAQFSPGGEIEEAEVGHFTVGEVKASGIPFMLTGYDSLRSSLFLAGMSQRTDARTLRRGCESLLSQIQGEGFPYHLGWNFDDSPEFSFFDGDGDNVRVISDMGLGFLTSKPKRFVAREIAVGFTSTETVMLSLAYQSVEGIPRQPLSLSILTRDQGKIYVPFSDR